MKSGKNTSSDKSGKTSPMEWLGPSEAAHYLGISIGTLRNWTSNGKVPYRKIGRLNRYKKQELVDLLNENRRGLLSWE
jgi:excisionase family DNA binding protein